MDNDFIDVSKLADFAISTILTGIKKQLTLTCMYNFFVDMFHSAAHIMLYIYNSKLFFYRYAYNMFKDAI